MDEELNNYSSTNTIKIWMDEENHLTYFNRENSKLFQSHWSSDESNVPLNFGSNYLSAAFNHEDRPVDPRHPYMYTPESDTQSIYWSLLEGLASALDLSEPDVIDSPNQLSSTRIFSNKSVPIFSIASPSTAVEKVASLQNVSTYVTNEIMFENASNKSHNATTDKKSTTIQRQKQEATVPDDKAQQSLLNKKQSKEKFSKKSLPKQNKLETTPKKDVTVNSARRNKRNKSLRFRLRNKKENIQAGEKDNISLREQKTSDTVKNLVPDRVGNWLKVRPFKKRNRRKFQGAAIQSNEILEHDVPIFISTNLSNKYTFIINEGKLTDEQPQPPPPRYQRRTSSFNNYNVIYTNPPPKEQYSYKPRMFYNSNRTLLYKSQNASNNGRKYSFNKPSNQISPTKTPFKDQDKIPTDKSRRTGEKKQQERGKSPPQFTAIETGESFQEDQINTSNEYVVQNKEEVQIPLNEPVELEDTYYIEWSLELEGMCVDCVREIEQTVHFTHAFKKKHKKTCELCYAPALIPRSRLNSCFRCGKINAMNAEQFAKFKKLLGDEEICNTFNSFNLWIQREFAADIFATWINWTQEERQIPTLKKYIIDRMEYQHSIHLRVK